MHTWHDGSYHHAQTLRDGTLSGMFGNLPGKGYKQKNVEKLTFTSLGRGGLVTHQLTLALLLKVPNLCGSWALTPDTLTQIQLLTA